MNAIYKDQKATVIGDWGEGVTLVIRNTEQQIDVDYGDADLVVDPTDDQWESAT